ncbi:glutaminase [Ornithinicoccus hortensis]|uniref:Glutaminase n=1 Tax=Ornithinicoccus hortensis TaxID=82346 RepID=A0A542YMR4_9MICO|nr:glutaminase [Ornithinicoccus hortensis]TQL49375.1 L-glutaminase [Ornithinicoccus hortensis]
MRSPVSDYLAEVLEGCAGDTSGANADYIPELARADSDRFAVAVATLTGYVHGAGDTDVMFTMQSISKPFVHALALQDRGLPAFLDKIDVEPSGEAFNELSLEEGTTRPRNPMINAGAITTSTLVGEPDSTLAHRWERILGGLSAFAGRELEVDEAVFSSELETAHRNLAIAHMLRGYDTITEDPEAVVANYTRQCSLRVTTRDLALMAATLANGGVQPLTGERVVDPPVVREVLSVMTTCGMYDAAGDWVTRVGIPAKSGVAGGIIGALPGQVGLAVFSPRLDEHGASVRGVRVCERLSQEMGMHLMEAPAPARSVLRESGVREVDGIGTAHVYALQGMLQFAGVEQVLHDLTEEPPSTPQVVLDLSQVYSVNSVGRRMLREAVRRLGLDGLTVHVVDPEGMLD